MCRFSNPRKSNVIVIIPISQMRKPRPREVKYHSQLHSWHERILTQAATLQNPDA